MTHKCECPYEGVNDGTLNSLYHPTLEQLYRAHAPGQCECTNDLRRFRRRSGAILWLCSICTMTGDEAIS